jgi:hypothetical protein
MTPLATSSKGVAVSRITRILSVAAIALVAAGPAVSAQSNKLESNLRAMWTTVLELPTPDNPFGGGGPASACIDLGGTLAPFAGGAEFSCTVKPGTKLFIAGYSAECSTWEGNGETDAELRQCAHDAVEAVVGDAGPTVTIDGRVLPLEPIETPLMEDIVLPADNIFLEGLGVEGGTPGLSVGFGWVALVHPLPPGTHTITDGSTFTTTIVVQPGA